MNSSGSCSSSSSNIPSKHHCDGTTDSIGRCSASNSSSLANCSFDKKSPTKIIERDRIPSSHYSTEKSASSGYYSSNIYSTSSSDDHIYSEPVIDIVDGTKKKRIRENRRAKIEQKFDQQIGLANLEKSIKSLEKHLKLLNKRQMLQQMQTRSCEMCGVSSSDEKLNRLPTIIEGADVTVNAVAVVSGKDVIRGRARLRSIDDTLDDSLLDVDLDSFLLANEMQSKKKMMTTTAIKAKNSDDEDDDGIENPTYEPDGDDDEIVDGNKDTRNPVKNSDKHIDNNYKCTKYINSCPDNAYNVEGVNDYKYSITENDKSTTIYMKNCGDQVFCQHTKDILKDIHEKLTLLTNPTDERATDTLTDDSDSNGSNKNGTSDDNAEQCRDEDLQKNETDSLKNSIQTLKRDLEAYLKLMNEQDEMEIKRFCSGLSKNYKLLTMQHALANKSRSMARNGIVAVTTSPSASNASLKTTSTTATAADNISELYSNRSYCSSGRGSGSSADYALTPTSDQGSDNYVDLNATRKSTHVELRPFRPRTESIDSVRCSSGSDSNFQLRRHSDSACSSWDDVNHIDSSQCDDTSGSVKCNDAAIQIECIQQTNVIAQSQIDANLVLQQPTLIELDKNALPSDDKDLMLEWHRNKPSIWQQYYGSKRIKYSNMMKKIKGKLELSPTMSYVSSIFFSYLCIFFWLSPLPLALNHFFIVFLFFYLALFVFVFTLAIFR